MARKRRRDDDDDDDDTPPRRRPRRRRRGDSTPWVVGGVLLGVALLVGIVLAVALTKGKDGAKGGNSKMVKLGNKEFPEEMLINDVLTMGQGFEPPLTWTHQDLAEHLRKKGIPVTIQHDASLGSANGQGVWFVDARPNAKRGRVRVYRCPSKRDAARQVVAMKSELYIPYIVGHFAVGIDGHTEPSDDDVFFNMNVKSILMQ